MKNFIAKLYKLFLSNGSFSIKASVPLGFKMDDRKFSIMSVQGLAFCNNEIAALLSK